MQVTAEFGNYQFLGKPLLKYARGVGRRIWRIKGRWRIRARARRTDRTRLEDLGIYGVNFAWNVCTATRHVLRLARFGRGPVTLPALVAVAGTRKRDVRIVGDKLPQYILRMHQFVEEPELLHLVIYRDCRDVTSSYLRKVRGDWRNRAWTRTADTAEKIARKWVRLIETMERNTDRLFILRYESLVTNPQLELERLAEWLGVDPSGFDATMVFGSSIGNYRRGLTPQELDDVMRVAGPTLERLGYLHDERVIG
jgi:hypothetical protein